MQAEDQGLWEHQVCRRCRAGPMQLGQEGRRNPGMIAIKEVQVVHGVRWGGMFVAHVPSAMQGEAS